MYPHLRGADQCIKAGFLRILGVSPPAWGRRRWADGRAWPSRCIPTCVGQTAESPVWRVGASVYPHLRGADPDNPSAVGCCTGVSPPAWGRLDRIHAHGLIKRCIPTCVGQTKSAPLSSRSGAGVSPPAWGRRIGRYRCVMRWRCIPTCVGQTRPSISNGSGSEVYPHLRGAD